MLAEALVRIPHGGPMRLIAVVENAGETRIRCRAADHMAADYPLRLEGVLHAAALVELGAQAAAAHASLFGMDGAHTGLVLAIGDLVLHRDRVDEPEPLSISAERLDRTETAAAYRFAVTQAETTLLAGEILLSMLRA